MYQNTLNRKQAADIIRRAMRLGARRTVEVVGPVYGKRKSVQVCLHLAAPWTREDGTNCHALAFSGHVVFMFSRFNRWAVRVSSQHLNLEYTDGAFSAGYTVGQLERHLAGNESRRAAAALVTVLTGEPSNG